jgi:hypothetical protein
MDTHSRESTKIGLVGLGLLCAGVALMVLWFGEGHGASLSRLAMVHPGMTRKEVVNLLGEPRTINRASDGFESWSYTRGTFCQVKIHLDANGKVMDTDHDH